MIRSASSNSVGFDRWVISPVWIMNAGRAGKVLIFAIASSSVPMALGLGEGGEQNAPLGRAVIGGLVFATVATLFFVPTVFSLIHGRRSH